MLLYNFRYLLGMITEWLSPSTADDDYSATLLPSVLIFPVGSVAGDTQCFDVAIIDDVLVEGVEDFFLSVVSVSPLVTVDQAANQAAVNIISTDGTSFLVSNF